MSVENKLTFRLNISSDGKISAVKKPTLITSDVVQVTPEFKEKIKQFIKANNLTVETFAHYICEIDFSTLDSLLFTKRTGIKKQKYVQLINGLNDARTITELKDLKNNPCFKLHPRSAEIMPDATEKLYKLYKHAGSYERFGLRLGVSASTAHHICNYKSITVSYSTAKKIAYLLKGWYLTYSHLAEKELQSV